MTKVKATKKTIKAKATSTKTSAKKAASSKAALKAAKAAVKKLLKQLVKQLDAEKAENIVTIDLEGKTDFADAMIIANGRSGRHVGALADKIARYLKGEGVDGVAVEGLPVCDWVLIDAHDIIIHLFRPEVRSFYDLERIWLDTDADKLSNSQKSS